MGKSLAAKIIDSHIEKQSPANTEIRIDYTLTQDATGTMAYLEFISMGLDRVRTQLSVSYVDHNTLQTGFENADDHLFLQTVADKYGIIFSKAGNGICHQLQLERFTKPGITLLGSDSHTPTSGAMGALAIGSGGLDIALAMAGKPFRMVTPRIINVRLSGKLRRGVTAKDVILSLLQQLTVKGAVNSIIEYSGEGVRTLSVCERATICNMGAELGATSSIFPSDDRTLEFLRRQQRENDFVPLEADPDAKYDSVIELDLSSVCALAACPSSPDNVKAVSDLAGMPVQQVLIGSCTNSSYEDMVAVASVLKGKKVKSTVSLGINPGSRQVLSMMAKNGLLYEIIHSGARILECTCGACIGMGQSPATDAVSLRTYNRNFYGRSGTNSAKVYLVSPVTAALSAINGVFTDPTDIKENLSCFDIPELYDIDDSLFIVPSFRSEPVMGPNIRMIPHFDSLEDNVEATVILKLEDNISTDHIMPAGAKVLPYRSNIERLSDFCFANVKSDFKSKALEYRNSVIVAGRNYGQGSSREHAAIVPRYLGLRAVFALSFARIHRQNLINFGIIPVEIDETIYSCLNEGDVLSVDTSCLENGYITIRTDKDEFRKDVSFTSGELVILRKGALLNV